MVVAMQSMQATVLLLAGAPFLLLACALSLSRFSTLLLRTRFIMLSLLLVYGYATPGVAVWSQLAEFSPTVEGVSDGLLQLCRLLFALAGLSVLLELLTTSQLIGGLYTMAYPLRHFGLSRERVAVRLALTLHHAELLMRDTVRGWRDHMEAMLLPPEGGQESVELHVCPFTLRDGALLVAGVALLVLARL